MARISGKSKDIYKYYVGILAEGSAFKFVTSLSYSPKEAHWEYDKPALAMSLSQAQDVVLGLTINGTASMVLGFIDGYSGLGNYDKSLYE